MRLSACILGFLVGGLNLVQGAIRIPQCSAHGWLEIRENQIAAAVTCTGFDSLDVIVWIILIDLTSQMTCDTSGRCMNPSTEMMATRPNGGSTSYLYIFSNHRNLAGNGVVKCWESRSAADSVVSCRINVISPVVLTICKLTFTTNGTVAGTCNFDGAYSSNGTYTCTWTLTPLDGQGGGDVTIPGNIHKTSYTSHGKTYYRGTCSFPGSALPAGQYSYTVHFSPGGQYQGTETVTGAYRIPQCSAQGWLEIREDQTAAVTCTGFDSLTADIKWQLTKGGNTIEVTCDNSGRCTDPSTEIRVTRPGGGSTSYLYIDRNHRNLAGNGVVRCLNPRSAAYTASCRTDVISPAVLTNCKLMLTTDGTLAGTCNFDGAYSSNGTYTCTWTLTPLGGQGRGDATIYGNTHKTSYTSSGKTYYRGTCSFTGSWLTAGQYSYTVRVSPGGQHQGTETVTDQSSSTEAYIVGGVVGAVLVIVLVGIVAVVVLVRRYLGRRLYDRPRRRRQLRQQHPEENPYTGLDVYEAVGQPAPNTSHTPANAHEIPDQETVPGVTIGQNNAAFTSDMGVTNSTCVGSQLYENNGPPDSSHPYKNDGPPASSHPNKNDNTPESSHPYKNDYQSGTLSHTYENDHQACDASHPYGNDSPPHSSHPRYQK